jgi:L-fuconolactonase
MIIDAHQHFWDLSRTDYDWLTPDRGKLYCNHLPADLAPVLFDHEVRATVLVQAAPSEAETRYLFGLAQAYPFIAGIVGWVDFQSAGAHTRISALIADGRGKLKGLRPMIQDIPDPNWLSQPSLDEAFEAMVRHDLVFDALVRPAQIAPLRARLMRHPKLRAVLDHAGKPNIANRSFDAWAKDLELLACDTTVYCKLSGLLTEAGARASPEDLAPYVAHVFDCFGGQRVLWGSDWPVLNLVCDYGHWLALSKAFVNGFAARHQNDVFSDTAARLYQLELP